MQFKNAVAALALASVGGVDAFFRLNCAKVQVGRIDPIVNPGALAAHCHTIVGGSSEFLASNLLCVTDHFNQISASTQLLIVCSTRNVLLARSRRTSLLTGHQTCTTSIPTARLRKFLTVEVLSTIWAVLRLPTTLSHSLRDSRCCLVTRA